jgi:hypothetical protein
MQHFTTDSMLPALAAKITKLRAMTTSSFDHESLTALRLANRTLKNEGLSWSEALAPEKVPALPPPALTPSEALCIDWPCHWRQAARYASTFVGFLPHKEVQFAHQLISWRGEPSEKQLKWLSDILAKVATVEARP